MKKSAIALSVVSLLGLGTFTMKVNASDQVSGVIEQKQKNTSINNSDNDYKSECRGQKDNACTKLTEEQKALMEKGYNELTKEEKDLFDKYHGQSKRELSEEEISKYHAVSDKVHKYMGEEFIAKTKEKREAKKLHKEEMQHNSHKGQGKGQGKGNKSCQ